MNDDLSLHELFAAEIETQGAELTRGLMELEKGDLFPSTLEALMRAAHSLKGAARMIGVKPAEKVAHAMEECFVAAQHGKLSLGPGEVDVLFRGLDYMRRLSLQPEDSLPTWYSAHQRHLLDILRDIEQMPRVQTAAIVSPIEAPLQPVPVPVVARDRSLRLAPERLDALMGLAGEVQVALGWLEDFRAGMLTLKRDFYELSDLVHSPSPLLEEGNLAGSATSQALSERLNQTLSAQLDDLQSYERRMSLLSSRLHQEVNAARMCPISERLQGFPRLVRDLARELGKEAELSITGPYTLVDREILERVEAPINHLLRNAVDHGLEDPERRLALGKPRVGHILLKASHRGGMLVVEVSDDGRGMDLEELRASLVDKGLVSAEMAPRLSEQELKEFLFLPNFTTRSRVSEVSGRGVGLDVVRTVAVELGGRVSLTTNPGQGMHFELVLPITVSVTRNLLVMIASEMYALPLARIVHLLRLPRADIREHEGKPAFEFQGRYLTLVAGHQVLSVPGTIHDQAELCVVVIGPEGQRYGMVVDSFEDEQSLALQVLEPRFGRLWNIAEGAILQDGSPVLTLNVDDLLCSIERLVSGGNYANVKRPDRASSRTAKRVLVVDDSVTVREVEKKLLITKGYDVDIAVDGLDAWNAIRSRHYDLVVTDIDMPRMDGIRLVCLVKQDPALRDLPMMIVSYKDRDEDRMRGLEAGADYYLVKSNFSDDSFLQAVTDLIGAHTP